eukprot:3968882-Pyramimonas_sp.AAC.1
MDIHVEITEQVGAAELGPEPAIPGTDEGDLFVAALMAAPPHDDDGPTPSPDDDGVDGPLPLLMCTWTTRTSCLSTWAPRPML